MDPAMEAQWNKWAEAHVKNALAQHDRLMTKAIGRALGMIRKQLREEFAAELASLRADMTVQVGVARGQIKEMKRDVA